MARRHQRYALTDEGGNDVNVELIDLAGVEERGDQLSAAHHPDMLSRRRAQTPRKGFHWLRDEFHARGRFLRRLPREHVIGDLLVKPAAFDALLLPIIESPVVGLASQKDGVNSRVERAHAVIEARPAIEPFHVAIRPGDVTVGAGGYIDDDLSPCFHDVSSASSNSTETRARGGYVMKEIGRAHV